MIHPKRHKKYTNALLELGALNVNETQCRSGVKPSGGGRGAEDVRVGQVKSGWGEGGGVGVDAQQREWNSPSPIWQLCNIFHRRRWSPPGSYTSKTRMSTSWWLGGTLFSSNEMFLVFIFILFFFWWWNEKRREREKRKHFSMFLHIRSLPHAHMHSHTHRQLPRRSSTGTALLVFKATSNQQTVKAQNTPVYSMISFFS